MLCFLLDQSKQTVLLWCKNMHRNPRSGLFCILTPLEKSKSFFLAAHDHPAYASNMLARTVFVLRTTSRMLTSTNLDRAWFVGCWMFYVWHDSADRELNTSQRLRIMSTNPNQVEFVDGTRNECCCSLQAIFRLLMYFTEVIAAHPHFETTAVFFTKTTGLSINFLSHFM